MNWGFPWELGRDELGKGWGLEWVGSCLRRNDGGGAGMTEEGAGITEEGAGMTEKVR